MTIYTHKNHVPVQVDPDIAELTLQHDIKWHINDNGYAVATVNKRTSAILGQPAGTTIRMHRWIMSAPSDMCIDHISRDKLDNRRSNLRICTQAENMCNKASWMGQSHYKGVSYRLDSPNKPWRAICYCQGRKHCLGSYATEEEAAVAYNEAARRYHGAYAVLNDVPETLAPVA